MHDCDRAILAEIAAEGYGYDVDLERETPADVAAYWADMIDVEGDIEAWEASREAAWRAGPIDPEPW